MKTFERHNGSWNRERLASALCALQPSIHELFQPGSYPAMSEPEEAIGLTPSCEIEERSSAYRLHLALPNTEPDHIKVTMGTCKLTVSVEARRDGENTNGGGRSPIQVQKYDGVFSIPKDIERREVSAEVDGKRLTVILPKVKQSPAQEIPVTVAS